MNKKSLNIALKLEGPTSENGLIRLDDLLKELRALEDALQSIDKELNGRNTLYYRVVNMSHNRAGRVVIQPVLMKKMKGPRIGNKWGHLPEKVHHAFFKTIGLITKDRGSDLGVGEPVIDAIAALLDGLGSDFARGEIANKEAKFKLDEKLKEQVEGLLRPSFQSHGSFEGQLLALNLARGNRFYIYPDVGPRSVSCQFPEALYEKAHAYLRKNVRVWGTKYFRESTGFPFRITDVQKLELLHPDGPYPAFTPSGIRVIGPNAADLVREAREEWD